MASVSLAQRVWSQPASRLAPVSSGKVTGVFAGALPVASRRPVLDPHGMHRNFPDIWADYLQRYYGGSRGRIMEGFRVDDRTVRAWLTGVNKPSGDKVALAAARHPDFFAELAVAP